jgi:AraC-like DNA-binding protein
MLDSHVFHFTDPDLYQKTIRASEVEILYTGNGKFRAGLTRIDLHRLWMQRGTDNLARTARVSIDPARSAVMFLPDGSRSATQLCGIDLWPGEIAVYGAGSVNLARTQGPSQWAALSLTPDDLATAGRAIVGRELVSPSGTYVLRPPQRPMARLAALHAATVKLARTMPWMLADPAVAKALEEGLVHAMITCLVPAEPAERKLASAHHAKVVTRFQEFLEMRCHEPVYIAEICSALAVSERTLRTCCHEQLGVGPVRYLWLRRMHLARRALLHAGPEATSVTKVATEHGFWELGRFSVEYRALFGESPSASLRRPPNGAFARSPII